MPCSLLLPPPPPQGSSAMRYHAGHSVQIVAQKTVSLAPLLHRWTVINTTTPSPPSFGFLFFPSSFLFSAGRTTEKHDIDYRCQRRFFFTFFLFYYYFIFIELVSICLICCSLNLNPKKQKTKQKSSFDGSVDRSILFSLANYFVIISTI